MLHLLKPVAGRIGPTRSIKGRIDFDGVEEAGEVGRFMKTAGLLDRVHLVYVAAGECPRPVVILLHGFPGYERNLDIAQDIRRNGSAVLYFDYRGSWGSPGVFIFSHCIEDAAAAIAYVRLPTVAKDLRADSVAPADFFIAPDTRATSQ